MKRDRDNDKFILRLEIPTPPGAEEPGSAEDVIEKLREAVCDSLADQVIECEPDQIHAVFIDADPKTSAEAVNLGPWRIHYDVETHELHVFALGRRGHGEMLVKPQSGNSVILRPNGTATEAGP